MRVPYLNTDHVVRLRGELSAFLHIRAGLGRRIPSEDTVPNRAVDLYLDLMKRLLCGTLDRDEDMRGGDFDPEKRREGRDWPRSALTMIGERRLDNVRHCVETVLGDDVPGDFIEAGVWRGGASIFMRAVLAAHRDNRRRVWVADSFKGLPLPDPEKYPADTGDRHHEVAELAVSLEEVKSNFARHGFLDARTRFLKGWFADTLPNALIGRLAVARLDGDMYGSTWDALDALYPKLSPGGFLIVDDYGAVPGCKQAVHDYRKRHGITEAIQPVDWTGAFWRKRH